MRFYIGQYKYDHFTAMNQEQTETIQSSRVETYEKDKQLNDKDRQLLQKRTPAQRSKDKIEQAKERHAHIKEIEEQVQEENSKKGKKTIARQRNERKEAIKKMDEKPQIFVKKTLEQKRADRAQRNANLQPVKNIDNNKLKPLKLDKRDDEHFEQNKSDNFNPFDVLRRKK